MHAIWTLYAAMPASWVYRDGADFWNMRFTSNYQLERLRGLWCSSRFSYGWFYEPKRSKWTTRR